MNTTRAIIEWQGKQITFEGPSEFVSAQLEVFRRQESKKEELMKPSEEYSGGSAAEIVGEKRPKGHHEIVAVLGFYVSDQGVTEFTEEDIKRAYLQARVRPPKVIGQALRDAKNKYDYIMAGKERGTYKLSPHGDRTVRFDLPRLGK